MSDPVSANTSTHSTANKQQHIPKQKDQNTIQSMAAQESVNSVTSLKKTDIEQPKSAQEEREAQEALQAQKDSAKWAFWSFIASVVGLLVSGAGLIYLIKTVQYTKSAVEHSETQAKQAIIAATVATEGVILASDTATRQLRAYVNVAGAITIYKGKGERFVEVEIKNYGATPAHSTKFVMGVGVNIDGIPVDFIIPDDIKTSVDVLAPNRTSKLQVPIEEICPHRADLLNNEMAAIFAFGRIEYRDSFDKPQVTLFRYICRGEGLKLGLMVPAEEGNSAT